MLLPATTTLELDASGAISQVAPLLNVATLVATGGSVVLTNPNNQIVSAAGLTASAGNVELVDGISLEVNSSATERSTPETAWPLIATAA